MEGERIHEMVVGDIPAQGRVIGAEHLLSGGRIDDAFPHVAAGMKQQRRAWRDTDVTYGEKHRAGGLTVTVDTEAFAGRIVLLYHCQELRKNSLVACAVAHAQR